MWNGSSQRIKALMSARERERLRLTRPIRVERADITLHYQHSNGNAIDIPARALLNEFTPSGICLFTTATLVPNLEMSVVISHPKEFTILAKVVWCQYQPSSSHVLTSQPFAYRVGLAFHFSDASQEEAFKLFCEEMHEKYTMSGEKAVSTPDVAAVASVTPINKTDTVTDAETASPTESDDKKAA